MGPSVDGVTIIHCYNRIPIQGEVDENYSEKEPTVMNALLTFRPLWTHCNVRNSIGMALSVGEALL